MNCLNDKTTVLVLFWGLKTGRKGFNVIKHQKSIIFYYIPLQPLSLPSPHLLTNDGAVIVVFDRHIQTCQSTAPTTVINTGTKNSIENDVIQMNIAAPINGNLG